MRALLLAFLVSLPVRAVAAPADQAAQKVRSGIERALEVLRDPALAGKAHRVARHARLRAISDESFDWTAMARRSLGVHWRGLKAKDRTRFTTTFRELLATHYLNQLDKFQGNERVEYQGAEKLAEGAVVKTQVVTGSRERIPLHFFVDGGSRVYDVAIEGISLTNHYRGSFHRALVNGSFDALMKRLERKVRAQAKRASG